MFGLLIGLGAKLTWDEYRFEVTSPGLGEPQWIYTLTLPLFSVLVVIARGRLGGNTGASCRPRRDGAAARRGDLST